MHTITSTPSVPLCILTRRELEVALFKPIKGAPAIGAQRRSARGIGWIYKEARRPFRVSVFAIRSFAPLTLFDFLFRRGGERELFRLDGFRHGRPESARLVCELGFHWRDVLRDGEQGRVVY